MAVYGGDLQFITPAPTAAADLSGMQYTIMRYSTAATTVTFANSQGGNAEDLIGVLWNKPKSGEHASIAYSGIGKVLAAGTVTAGVWITTNTSGRAANATSGDLVFGQALEAATTDGEVIGVKLVSPFKLAAL